MKRWLPYPLTSAILFLTWLAINQSVSFGHLFLALLLALVLPVVFRPLRSLPDPYFYRPWVLARLIWFSTIEVIRSCFQVSRIILSLRPGKKARSQFVNFPLELKDPYGLAMLAGLINLTPGTVWSEMLSENELVVHVFDVHDEAWWIQTIKRRYEYPLLEIFEGKEKA